MAPLGTMKAGPDATNQPLMDNHTSASVQNGKGASPPHREEEDTSGRDEPRDYECGLGSWRPSGLQHCASMRYFTATLSLVTVLGSMNFSYYTAIITQIEKAFGLSSSMTGFIKNVDNIGSMAVVLLVSHFCRYANKPRLFAGATLATSISISLFALPHFIYGPGSEVPGPPDNGTFSKQNSSKYELCNGVEERDDKCNQGSNSYLHAFNAGALALFILSELLQGVAQSPKFTLSITYMDDNAKDNSPKHFGFMMGMRALSPILGFLLGAWTTNLYVDLSEPDLDPQDPRWVGAWWLGFIICAAASLIPAFPLLLFPRKMKGEEQEKQSPALRKDEEDKKDIMKTLKDIPSAFLRIAKNSTVLIVVLGLCAHVFLMGFSTFGPKYMEVHFQLTASMASIITGCTAVVSYSIGPMLSGQLVSRFKMSPAVTLRFVVVCYIIGLAGLLIMMFLGCEGAEWGGTMTLNEQEVLMGCNSNCSCDATQYIPVCGSDGRNYFSPCLAGCQNWALNTSAKVFTQCQCIEGGAGMATPGLCRTGCPMLIPYLIVQGLSMFTSSLTFVPIMTIIIRSVSEKDKALALAFMGTIMQIVSFPAPMVFGLVVDTTCMVTQQSCDRKGACLLYDVNDFRLKIHGFAAAVKAVSLIAFIIACYVARNMTGKERPGTEEPHKSSEKLALREKEDMDRETNI